jgi:PhnB protein
MHVIPLLNYAGQCEAAFEFYQVCFGAKLGPMFRYAGTPLLDQVPAGWDDKVMHANITIGDLLLQGGDVAPEQYEEPKGFSLSIQLSDTSEAERIFQMLATEGTVVMPLAKTFWAERFGIVVDPWGVRWLINCDG